MSSLSLDSGSDIQSELIDLGSVSLRALRELNQPELRHALRHVMRQAEIPRVAASGGSEPGSRVD